MTPTYEALSSFALRLIAVLLFLCALGVSLTAFGAAVAMAACIASGVILWVYAARHPSKPVSAGFMGREHFRSARR